MSNHQATEQMLGYLYQVRYALFLLLDSDDESAEICLEKFDDVAFMKDSTPELMIQLKHHVKKHGDLSDASVDIWRTIKVWIDFITLDKNRLNCTKFIIMTTAKSPVGSAAYFLKPDPTERNPKKAFEFLKYIADTSSNKAHACFYKSFNNLGQILSQKLIDNIYVIDNSSNIVEVEPKLRKLIKYTTQIKYQDHVFERLEGWWYKKAIDSLYSIEPIFVSQNQIRFYISNIASEYAADNLPIDEDVIDGFELGSISQGDNVLYEQLKLICLSSKRMELAIRDYFRAFKQRNNWVRDDLLYINELDNYERKLIEEWEHLYYEMQEDLKDYNSEVTEDLKVTKGKNLFKEIGNKDVRIREKCSEPFIMRGSYQILANQMKVGWHLDFQDRLKHLLSKVGDSQ